MENTSADAPGSVLLDQNNFNTQEVTVEVQNQQENLNLNEDSSAFSPVNPEAVSFDNQTMDDMSQNQMQQNQSAEKIDIEVQEVLSPQQEPQSELIEEALACPENHMQNLSEPMEQVKAVISECKVTAVSEEHLEESVQDSTGSCSVEPLIECLSSYLPKAHKGKIEIADGEPQMSSTNQASQLKLLPPQASQAKEAADNIATSDDSAGADDSASAAAAEASVCQITEEMGTSKRGGTASSSQGDSVYYIKWITFDNAKVPIITQNENGPCPLLAIMNVLLLKGKVKLAPMLEMVTSEQLMAYLGECVIENMPQNLPETERANYEQNMQDAMAVMHKLQTGLDVNVKFTGVSDFEYTPECIIFDLLEIGLYHGWLVDPQDQQTVRAVGKCSYNQLVEKIIQQKSSEDEDDVREALLAEQFLERTASQLTYHGLCELSSTVKESELCIFFRNNHFSTLFCHNKELFLLVTDQGFLTESNVVWETLSTVDGDCHFVDAFFRTFTKADLAVEANPEVNPYTSGDRQIDSDYQVALSLQQDQQLEEQDAAWSPFLPDMQNADHELAMRLQEEEDRRAAAAASQEQYNTGQQPVRPDRRVREREDTRDRRDGKNCVLL
ncbi:ubiquitin carboxyl-terminal hydrolase MINDY-1-like isoform X2 [Pomacea canaliculata]|uniref:ubiquitin carboxyl-terminal hydrolase MINDY-1-like isoform X2 n=1 Tax=Pomacea canaliculata TaxID=400727 RepID=UPI000D7369DB|nr:ubiquitin carboxyl-terminal hydrolase MINDY-1-like isoform X2 [Pomacea canaliculata]